MSQISLNEATVQDMQLELIQRRRFNAFDGPRIADSFKRHGELWIAVYMDRLGIHDRNHPDWIPASSLIKLRDLSGNTWNVDSLFVLTSTIEQAQELAEIAIREEWCADEVIVQENKDELSMALGIGPCPYYLLTAWWD